MGRTPNDRADQPPSLLGTAHLGGLAQYEELYRRSLEDIDGFWGEQARHYLTWEREWDFVLRHDPDEALTEWFGGGLINASVNCLDRHVEKFGDKVAYYWEGDDPRESSSVSYAELLESVNRLAGFLKFRGVRRGDTVLIYAPTLIEVPTAMLACARIGAVHCLVSLRYSCEVLAERLRRCKAKVLIAADGYHSAGRAIPLKDKVDEAIKSCPEVDTVIIIRRCGPDHRLPRDRQIWWHDAMQHRSARSGAAPESMSSEDPLFIIFASGAIGKPHPLVHTHGGYLLWAAMTSRLAFDLHGNDTFWCTGDPASIAAHSLGVYGALINGVTSVLFEGLPTYPDFGRFWEIISRYRVNKFCTGITQLRTLAAQGAAHLEGHDISCLKLIGAADQALSPELWNWYDHFVGKGRCPVISTWWQEETGGPTITPLPGMGPCKAGSVSRPFFGIAPTILDLDTGETTKFPNQEGAFFIGGPWPGVARTIFGDHEVYREEYFAPFPGLFITGEGAKKDEDGCYWMTGRIDDVFYVAGIRVGAWEVESALVGHPDVIEATLVGYPHPIKGQCLYAFVTLTGSGRRSDKLKQDLAQWLETKIGSVAIPDVIQWADDLPKTRSGKILRRLLQKIAEGQVEDLGDLSTVANPEVIGQLIRDRMCVAV